MCGIAGALITDAARSRPDLDRMIRTLRHRGPDGFRVLELPRCGLAHARLSIIDLEAGAQPIANEDETVWTVLNGEIFNYLELRADLEARGHRFRTRSDTEVIVHGYEEHGEQFVDRLIGQFAIALWDEPNQKLMLVRDRVGVRPLFVARAQGWLLFASEVKAILAVAPEAARLDGQGLAQVFTFWGTVGDRTVFEGIKSLPAGHRMVIEGPRERLHQYWDWTFPDQADRRGESLEEAAGRVRELLADAVRLQLRSDVPVGAYLSGGLDSSGIAALARKATPALHTFSVTFDDREYDESEHQRHMAETLGTEHSAIRCRDTDIGQSFPELIWHTEIPLLRTAPAPLMLLSKHVRDCGFKVVLTGEGADEVFGGYDLFKEGKIRRFWARQPESDWRPLLFSRLYPYLARSPVANRHLARAFFGQRLQSIEHPFYAHLTRWATTRGLFKLLSPDWLAQLSKVDPQVDLERVLPSAYSRWNALARDQYVEVKTLLEGYLLCSQGDRVALANSIESRVPYLDHRLIEYVNGLDPRLKLRGLREKRLLRRALAEELPASIRTRIKQPYRAPDSRCFFSGNQPLPYVRDLLSVSNVRRSGYFRPDGVGRLLDKCRSGRSLGVGDNMALVGVVSTLLLHEHFLSGRVAESSSLSA